MLDYITLNNKPTTSRLDSNGNSVYFKDLLTKTWSTWNGSKCINPIIVNEYYVARPDLISLAIYGTDEYADMICKFNGISNPFEINEDMVLFMPPLHWAQEGTSGKEQSSCDIIEYNETIEQKDDIKKLRTDVRSSSTATVGDAEPFVIDKTLGLVFY